MVIRDKRKAIRQEISFMLPNKTEGKREGSKRDEWEQGSL